MNALAQVEPKASARSFVPALRSGLLQRKHAYAETLTGIEKGTECSRNREPLQRVSLHSAVARGSVLGHDLDKVNVQPNGRATDNRTNMPDGLLAGLQHLSGMDLSAIRVHYNSSKPALVGALAYTEGANIELGPGQERHLPHEGWHAVQQMQARVTPTRQAKGVCLNDDALLEHEADVMGAKASALQARGRAGLNGNLPALIDPQPLGAGLVSPVAVQAIQRVANFLPGTVDATTNLAAHFVAGNRDTGFTPPTLNGTTVMSATSTGPVISAAAIRSALRPPELGGRSNADGTVDAWVTAAPVNEASFRMKLPAPPPWDTQTSKASVAALFASIAVRPQPACSAAGDTTFTVVGKPTDADFRQNVRTHENLHVTDLRNGFDGVIVPWDARLQAAQSAGTTFNGPTQAAAEGALHTAMGGTPDHIASAQQAIWVLLNNVTHSHTTSATGGLATPSNSAADSTCTVSSLDIT